MFGMLNIVDPSHQPSDTCGLSSLSLHSLGWTRFPRALVLVETVQRLICESVLEDSTIACFFGHCSTLVVYGKQHSCCGAENAEAFLVPVPDDLSLFLIGLESMRQHRFAVSARTSLVSELDRRHNQFYPQAVVSLCLVPFSTDF